MVKTVILIKTLCLMFVSFLSIGQISAQKTMNRIQGIDYSLEVYNDPLHYNVNESTIEITAKGKTNLFNSPNGKYYVQNAPMLLFEPKSDFTLSAKVSGSLKDVYDVAALVVYQNKNSWAKLCYENSVNKEPTIVSVVTRNYSDDCNSETTGSFAYLSVTKKGEEFSFFYSKDRQKWKLIRHFHLNITDKLKVGFASHGSRGDGFTAIFTDIKYCDKALDDMRNL